MGADLLDTDGNKVWTGEDKWYKITLADGTELGLGELDGKPDNGRTWVKIVPAGQGMVFRYKRIEDTDREGYGWPQGDVGYLRGLQVKPDGTEVIKDMSLSYQPLQKLCMFDVLGSYGFVAQQLGGNKVALYARNSNKELVGLQVLADGHIIVHKSKFAAPLACSFVRVGQRFTGFF